MSHYPFEPDPDKNAFVFTTHSGWLYSLSLNDSSSYFADNEILYNKKLVFEICFNRSAINETIPKKGTDILIQETILAILLHHFEDKGHLPLYIFICYAGDGKEAARLNMFFKWFEAADTNKWQLYGYDLSDSKSKIYYGLFINEQHPFASKIPDEFEHFVQNEKSAWKELLRRR